MTPLLLVAGTGRMGRGIGLHAMRCGYAVHWLARTPERAAEFASRIEKDVRRLSRADPELPLRGRATVGCYGEAWPAEAMCLVEAVAEEGAAKAWVFDQAAVRLPKGALLLSSTSSFLPDELSPRCVVTHFFHPIELAGFAEVVWPADCGEASRTRVLELLSNFGLEAVEQSSQNAFAANRLLLPLQTECFRALAQGEDPEGVDAASRSALFPLGQLTFIERVGPSTVLNAVRNYRSRMGASEAEEHAPLEQGLARLAAEGRSAFPCHGTPGPNGGVPLRQRLLCALLNACYRLLSLEELDRRTLDLFLGGFFWAESSLEEVLARVGRDQLRTSLRLLHAETGLSYFAPPKGVGNGFVP